MYGQPLTYFCHKILPAVYDDSMSYYEVLCKLTQKVNEFIDKDDAQDEAILALQKELAELWLYLEGDEFHDDVEDFIRGWLEANIGEVIEPFIKQVFFGLTSDGYFCAYVPESWSDIQFDTGAAYGEESYGRLILRYSVAGEGVIDNTKPNYPNKNLEEEIKALQDNMHEVRHTLYTALTERRL